MNPKMSREVAVSEATRLFKDADVDNNGSISFSEWCAAGIKMQSQPSNMKQAFGAAVSKKIQA
jgi:Ca2+-binding EF-hand superfamily protein